MTAYLDTITGEQHVFRTGDFYMIEHGVVYAQKSSPHTEILFIKVPPGNDKIPVDSLRMFKHGLSNRLRNRPCH